MIVQLALLAGMAGTASVGCMKPGFLNGKTLSKREDKKKDKKQESTSGDVARDVTVGSSVGSSGTTQDLQYVGQAYDVRPLPPGSEGFDLHSAICQMDQKEREMIQSGVKKRLMETGESVETIGRILRNIQGNEKLYPPGKKLISDEYRAQLRRKLAKLEAAEKPEETKDDSR